MKKLGRGLDSLIEDTKPEAGGGPAQLDAQMLQASPFQPRETMGDEGLAELVESVRAHGILQPILVRPVEGGFQIVAGERRWRAAKAAGLEKVPVTIRDVPDHQMLELALVENLQREDLNPIEKARAYRRYVESLSLTHEGAAQRLGKDRTSITNQIRLLELPPEVQEMVSRGTLSMGHARALLGLPTAADRIALAHQIEKNGLSVRDVERLVRDALEAPQRPTPPPKEPKSPHFVDLERRLRERYMTKAHIDGGKERGKITLEYFSMQELTRLLEAMLGEELL